MARKTATFQRKINGMEVVQGELRNVAGFDVNDLLFGGSGNDRLVDNDVQVMQDGCAVAILFSGLLASDLEPFAPLM
ncbi:MAG: hypothetical protein ACK4RN_08540 [Pseudorhodobacter sp.]